MLSDTEPCGTSVDAAAAPPAVTEGQSTAKDGAGPVTTTSMSSTKDGAGPITVTSVYSAGATEVAATERGATEVAATERGATEVAATEAAGDLDRASPLRGLGAAVTAGSGLLSLQGGGGARGTALRARTV